MNAQLQTHGLSLAILMLCPSAPESTLRPMKPALKLQDDRQLWKDHSGSLLVDVLVCAETPTHLHQRDWRLTEGAETVLTQVVAGASRNAFDPNHRQWLKVLLGSTRFHHMHTQPRASAVQYPLSTARSDASIG